MAASLFPATALAHGGGPGFRGGAIGTGQLVAASAKRLNVTTAKLKGTIVAAANARIDAALAAEDIDAAEATELKERVGDNVGYAISVSRTATVASSLGVTVAALNTAFRESRRALIGTRIDEAVEDGDISAADAAELKADLADAELPGYHGGGGFGYHGGGPRSGFRRG